MIVVEEIARADAAAAWNLMLGATYGLWAAFLFGQRTCLLECKLLRVGW